MLSEIPILSWSKREFAETDEIVYVLTTILNSQDMLEICNDFYPKRLTEEETKVYKSKLGEDALMTIKSACCAQIDECRIIRLYSVFCHNALSSGLYKLVRMFNHSCIPNCHIFAPRAGSLYSAEIWTCCPVEEGEELRVMMLNFKN